MRNPSHPFYFVLSALGLAVAISSAASAEDLAPRARHLDRKGDRIEERLDRRGERVEGRLASRSDRVENRGERRAGHIEKKGKRVERRHDRRTGVAERAKVEPYVAD